MSIPPASLRTARASQSEQTTWRESAQGRYCLDWETRRIDPIVANIFGFHALQLGMPECNLLAQNRITCRHTASDYGTADLRCDPHHLPFANASIDLLVLPHVLEFHADPHQILRETERVLIPEGHLLITGFNPFSLWGIRRYLTRSQSSFPWCGHYLSLTRLKDWLKLLNFEIAQTSNGIYAPPCRSEINLQRWHFSESVGQRCWPFFGGIYFIHAIKRVHNLRLILPAWKNIRQRNKVITAVTHKENTDGS